MSSASRSQPQLAPGRVDWAGFACYVIIGLTILAAFLPSLAHAPRGDQWAYLMDMMGQESCGDLISSSYSYNRTRVIKPGDTMLFRPLLFAHLSLMTCAGGTRIWFPQAFGIALHIGVAWLLFALLRRLLTRVTANARVATICAVLVALYFATTPAIMEQVIWSHVNAYLLAALCVLGVVHVLSGAAANGEVGPREIVATVILSTLACLALEIALFLPVTLALCALMGWFPTRPGAAAVWVRLRLAAAFLLPMVIYFGAYYVDMRMHPAPRDPAGEFLAGGAGVLDTARNLVRYLAHAVAYPYFGGKPAGFTGTRVVVLEAPQMLAAFAMGVLVCILGVAAAGAYAVRRLPERVRHPALVAGAIALAWLLSIALAITVGRINAAPTQPGVIATISYHNYTPYLASMLLLCIASGCVAVAAPARFAAHRPRRWLILTLLALMMLAIGVRASLVHSVNVQLARHQAPLVDAVDAINGVRSRDPFASFRMSAHTMRRLERYHGVPVLYTLFARSIDQCAGTYEILAAAPYVVAAPGGRECDPILVRPDTLYHYYYHGGAYLGMPYWFEFPDVERAQDSPYVVRAATLEAAMREQPARLDRLRRDLRDRRVAGPEWDRPFVPFR